MVDASGGWRVREESVSLERLDGETILINFDTGQYFSFRDSSADVLWLIQTRVARAQWAAPLEDAFADLTWDDSIDAQVDAFLADLARMGIIEESSEPDAAAASLPADYERGPWSPPSAFANDDLADLLVIDPIHDAGDDGWPQSRSS